jgi:hypothetical protein
MVGYLRIKKLLVLPVIAFCWKHKVGEWKHDCVLPIAIWPGSCPLLSGSNKPDILFVPNTLTNRFLTSFLPGNTIGPRKEIPIHLLTTSMESRYPSHGILLSRIASGEFAFDRNFDDNRMTGSEGT